MLKSMAFIDYQNFNINLNNYYKQQLGAISKSINYSLLAKEVNNKINLESVLVKTIFFAPKPCEALLSLEKYQKFDTWLKFLKTLNYFEVIEGTHVIKPKEGYEVYDININDYKTYYIEEKGTDVNIAVNILTKAYNNAFDIAIIISGDTDFLPIIEELKRLGKIVILATLPNQNIYKFKTFYDQNIVVDDEMLNHCKTKKKGTI